MLTCPSSHTDKLRKIAKMNFPGTSNNEARVAGYTLKLDFFFHSSSIGAQNLYVSWKCKIKDLKVKNEGFQLINDTKA